MAVKYWAQYIGVEPDAQQPIGTRRYWNRAFVFVVGAIGIFGSSLASGDWASFTCWPCLLGKLAAVVIIGTLYLVLSGPGLKYPRVLAWTTFVSVGVALFIGGLHLLGNGNVKAASVAPSLEEIYKRFNREDHVSYNACLKRADADVNPGAAAWQ